MRTTIFILSLLLSNTCFAIDDLAYKLASLDEGKEVDRNGIEIKRADNALKIAQTVCDEKNEENLGEQAWRTVQLMRKDNVYARPIDILEGLKAILDGVDKKQDCASYMVNYATIRTGTGQSHSEAVAGMRVLMNATGAISYPKK